jgi:hypothetical protein
MGKRHSVKFQVVMELLAGDKTPAQVAKEAILPSSFSRPRQRISSVHNSLPRMLPMPIT